MTNPIPGADSEPELPPLHEGRIYDTESGPRPRYTPSEMRSFAKKSVMADRNRFPRAAAKVGADVAMSNIGKYDVLPVYKRQARGVQNGDVVLEEFYAADDVRKYLAAGAPAETPNPDTCAEMRALCEYCGGTGDVHSVEGEWHGRCVCPAGAAQAAPVQPATSEKQRARDAATTPSIVRQGDVLTCTGCGTSSPAENLIPTTPSHHPAGTVWTDEEREVFRKSLRLGNRCAECGVIEGGAHHENCQGGGA